MLCFYFQESASLADRLIQDQVTRAQEAEEMYALKNDISTTKQKLCDTQKQLEQADGLIGDIKQRVIIHLLSTLHQSLLLRLPNSYKILLPESLCKL